MNNDYSVYNAAWCLDDNKVIYSVKFDTYSTKNGDRKMCGLIDNKLNNTRKWVVCGGQRNL